jgi:hypothetical protein
MSGPNAKKSKQLVAEYIGKRVTAKLDGTLFDHVPATFRFRFEDPKKLIDEIVEGYSDYLGDMECLDDEGEWSNDDLIPVAAVSSLSEELAANEDEDEEVYEFAWVFLNWKAKSPPGVMITTTDDWGDDRTEKNLAALKLKVG